MNVEIVDPCVFGAGHLTSTSPDCFRYAIGAGLLGTVKGITPDVGPPG